MDLIQWKSAGTLQLYFLIYYFCYPQGQSIYIPQSYYEFTSYIRISTFLREGTRKTQKAFFEDMKQHSHTSNSSKDFVTNRKRKCIWQNELATYLPDPQNQCQQKSPEEILCSWAPGKESKSGNVSWLSVTPRTRIFLYYPYSNFLSLALWLWYSKFSHEIISIFLYSWIETEVTTFCFHIKKTKTYFSVLLEIF